jgi:hypothetical protein
MTPTPRAARRGRCLEPTGTLRPQPRSARGANPEQGAATNPYPFGSARLR